MMVSVIAVIAAAIAASEGKTSTDGFVVRSIRKVNRQKKINHYLGGVLK